MKFTAACAILSITFTGASASFWGGWTPSQPSIHKPQINACGNGVQAYCCDNGDTYGGKVNCNPLSQSNICSTTIVCCNAQDSTQACVGNLDIENNGWGW